jgi:hypothetical protein
VDHPEHVAVAAAAAVTGDVVAAAVADRVDPVVRVVRVAPETRVDEAAASAAEAVVPGAIGHRNEKIQASKNA